MAAKEHRTKSGKNKFKFNITIIQTKFDVKLFGDKI